MIQKTEICWGYCLNASSIDIQRDGEKELWKEFPMLLMLQEKQKELHNIKSAKTINKAFPKFERKERYSVMKRKNISSLML